MSHTSEIQTAEPVEKEIVDCYACGDKPRGPFSCPDCLLCAPPHGEGNMRLFKEFRHQVVVVTDIDGKEVTFNPPSYVCVNCKDTKKSTYRVWDPNYVPFPGACNIRYVGTGPEEMACHRCMPD